MLGDEVFMQLLSIFRVESAPKYGIVLTLGYASRIEEGFAKRVELALVVDNIGFITHALACILVREV